jgi:hypothetical protein
MLAWVYPRGWFSQFMNSIRVMSAAIQNSENGIHIYQITSIFMPKYATLFHELLVWNPYCKVTHFVSSGLNFVDNLTKSASVQFRFKRWT